MTTGIPHGPLSSADLPKLTGLSVLLSRVQKGCDGLPILCSFTELYEGQLVYSEPNIAPDGVVVPHSALSKVEYLGERPEPGSPVILAPEGGWKRNPVPGRRVNVVWEGENIPGPSEEIEWSMVSAFSLIEDAKPEDNRSDWAKDSDDAMGADRPAQSLSDLAGMEGETMDDPVLWMVHVIGPDEIHPAPDHATAVEWCEWLNSSIPSSDVLCVAVPAIWTGNREGHASGLAEAVASFSQLRPASPPAETGEGLIPETRLTIGQAFSRVRLMLTHGIEEDGREGEDDRDALRYVLDRARATSPSDQSDTERMRALVEAIPQTDGMRRRAVEIYGSARNLGPDNLASFALNQIELFVEDVRAALAEKEAGQ